MPAGRMLCVLLSLLNRHVEGSAPVPVSFWKFQEPTGSARLSSGVYNYALTDGDLSHPIEQVDGGLFGTYAAYFSAASDDQRLRANRSSVPALTIDIAGPSAVVSMVAWIKRINQSAPFSKGFLAGVWGDTGIEARRESQSPLLNAHAGQQHTHGHLPISQSMPCISTWVCVSVHRRT
jgi:hypothetical protein